MRISVYSVVLKEVVLDVLQLVLMFAALLWRIPEKSPAFFDLLKIYFPPCLQALTQLRDNLYWIFRDKGGLAQGQGFLFVIIY